MQNFFGLKQMPFNQEVRIHELVETFDTKEVESRLTYLRNQRGIMRLTGEPGSGKTTVLRKWVDTLNPQSFTCCYTPQTAVSKVELYRQLNAALKLPQKIRKVDLFAQIQTAIWEQYEQGKVTCMIFDECQMMVQDTLQEFIPLTNFFMDSKLPFILLLVGQAEFIDQLKRSVHQPLRQRIHTQYHMAGLDLDEVKKYIESHLLFAGRKDPLFDPSAIAVIHQLSYGLPRKINSYALTTMRLAFRQKNQNITGDMVLAIAPEVE